MYVRETPAVRLIGSWGSESLVSALTDVLYRGVSLEEALKQGGDVVARRISAFYRQGHWSVFEFMGAQFLVECSRACHTQFIRHRLASYWSESQRYVDYARREVRFVVPRGFPADLLKRAYEDYVRLREGWRPEYARMVLPNATAVLFAVQMNARELLLNFVPLRCAYAAQAEIRHVCWQMYAHAWRLWPTLSRLVWDDLPSLHRDFCTKVPKGEDCRLYAIRDAEEKHGPLPKPWEYHVFHLEQFFCMRKAVALLALAVGVAVAAVFILFFNTGSIYSGSISYEANYTVSDYAVYGKDKIPLSGWMIVGVKGDEGYAAYKFEVEYLLFKFRLTGAGVVKDGIYYMMTCMNDECQVEKTRVDELPMHPITRQILKKEVSGFKAAVKELGDCEHAGRKGKLYEIEMEIEGRYAELLYGERGPIYENSLICLADFGTKRLW